MSLFSGPLTGRKVGAIFLSGFLCITAANLTLVYYALGSWPGLEVQNTYTDSLGFEERRNQQELLNWKTGVRSEKGEIILSMTDAQGRPVYTHELQVLIGLATHSEEDRTLNFQFDGKDYRAEAELAPGNWQARIQATSMEGVGFRQILPLIVRAD
jgi:nitrogen fixation protein FixH